MYFSSKNICFPGNLKVFYKIVFLRFLQPFLASVYQSLDSNLAIDTQRHFVQNLIKLIRFVRIFDDI